MAETKKTISRAKARTGNTKTTRSKSSGTTDTGRLEEAKPVSKAKTRKTVSKENDTAVEAVASKKKEVKKDGPAKASRKKTTEKRTAEKKPRSTSNRVRKPTKSERAIEAVASWIASGGGLDFKLFNKRFSDAKLTETHFKTLYKKNFADVMNKTSVRFDFAKAAEYLKVIVKGKARVGYDLSTVQVTDGTLVVRYFGDKDSLPLISLKGNTHAKPGRVIAKVVNNTTLEVECIYFKLERDALWNNKNYIRVDKTGAHIRSGICLKDEFAGTAKLKKQFTIENN